MKVLQKSVGEFFENCPSKDLFHNICLLGKLITFHFYTHREHSNETVNLKVLYESKTGSC